MTSTMPLTSEVTSDYSGSLTPTSSGEESSEEEEEDARGKKVSESMSLLWSGTGAKRVAFIMFRPESLIARDKRLKAIGEKYHLAYKMVKTESKLVRSVLSTYGFHEVHPNSPDFNLMWTGAHLKPFSLRSLQDFQKVNHFPRSYEITRKDRLFKNIDRMAHTKGAKHFDFMPKSYIMPSEYQDFCAAYVKDKGPWIVKPIASSRGRGIYLINNPNQVPLEDNIMVCKYISNPLLIDGFKFDIRVYIAVTSYDPLMIYLFEEGLTRFATVKYEKTHRHLKNQMMHLTNYSINKKSHDYVRCEDPDVEDYGNKWSMSAMLRYLKQEGIDTTSLMMRIEAVIIKAIIAAELPIATACKMFVPHRENCMELYGFDILVDENLKPWLLEGNLSPSLACDAPLDLKIKSCMVSDFFSLVGFQCVDPLTRRQKKDQMRRPYSASKGLTGASSMQGTQSKRPVSASGPKEPSSSGLSNEEAKVLRIAKEQYQRRGSFIRIFPTPETWELHGSFLEYKSNFNQMLAQKLFPERARSKASGAYSTAVARMRSIAAGQMLESRNRFMTERFMQYERKLLSLESLKNKREKKVTTKRRKKETPVGIDSKALAQGQLKKAARAQPEEESDSSDDEDESGDDSDVAESELPAKKDLPKTTSKAQSLGSATSKTSSASVKPKKATSQKAGGGGGDLNPLTKSAYASARTRETSAKSSQISTISSLTSTSRSNISAKTNGVKSARKVEKNPDNAVIKQGPAQRVYTYKNVTKQEAGDAKSPEPSASTLESQNTSDDDTSSDSSSGSDDEQQQHKSSSHKPQQNTKSASTAKHATTTTTPRTKQQKKTLDVLHALKSGGNLGKVQARQAFSSYLSRVQQRLMAESESHSQESSETVTKQEEQMDLVLRFLKRAAGNLRQSFAVVVPSRRLCLPDRKRILAKQLGDFVHIYNKETDAMEQKQSLGLERETTNAWSESVQENTHIKETDFRFFVLTASEAELEEVLTTYTHKNKSASVFLGASKPKSREKREISTPTTAATVPSTPTRLQSRNRLTTVDHLPTQPLVHTGQLYQAEEHREDLYELNLHRRSQSAFSTLRMRSPSPASSVTSLSSRTGAVTSHYHHGTPHPSSAYLHPSQSMSLSSLQQASYIYNAKLTPPSAVTNANQQKRPSSARDFNANGQPTSAPPTSVAQNGSRPISAATGRGGLGGSLHYQTAANEEAIADALQKLAERQAARQYSATSQLQALTQHLSSINLANMSAARQQQLSQQAQHGFSAAQRASSLSDLATNDPSVQSMMEPSLWDVEPNHSTAAGIKFGSRPPSGPSSSSGAQNPAGQPQALAQQSKELLQQSKAKHQAMVAQVARVIDEYGEQTQFEYVTTDEDFQEPEYQDVVTRERRSLLDSLMWGDEEGRGESEAGSESSRGYRIESMSAIHRWDSPASNLPETSLYYCRFIESYVPIKYSASKVFPPDKKSSEPMIQDNESPKNREMREVQDSGKNAQGSGTEKSKGKIPPYSRTKETKPKSRVEHVWNSYHKNENSKKFDKITNKTQNSKRKNKKGKSAPAERTNSNNHATCGALTYKNALGWPKNATSNGSIVKDILSDIKSMFDSGELPCKRWRYQTSGTGYVRPSDTGSGEKREKKKKQQEKMSHKISGEIQLDEAHNMVSMGLDPKAQASPFLPPPGDDVPNVKQRPGSALPTNSRPPQVPRPPEKPKPTERAAPPIRKPLGSTKISRTGSHPQLTGISPNPSVMTLNDEGYRANFYNSLKYDTSTGTTKLIENGQDFDAERLAANNAVEVGSRPSSAKRPTWKP